MNSQSTPIQSDPQTDQFLDLLFSPDDLIEFRFIETWDVQGKKQSTNLNTLWVTRKDVNAHLSALKQFNGLRGNVFFGVHPRKDKSSGDKSNVASCRCLWADIDDTTPDVFKAKVHTLGLPKPTIIVNSGHGIHAYWMLQDPIPMDATKDDKGKTKDGPVSAHISNVVKRLLLAIGGQAMAGTQDIARILRLPHPELFNVKNARNGAIPTPVTIVHLDPQARYTIADIESCLPPDVSPPQAPPTKVKASKVTGKIQAPPQGKVTNKSITDIIADLDILTGDRSARDFAVCCRLVERGIDRDKAWSLVRDKSKFADRGQKYFDDTWDKATMTTVPQMVKNEFRPPPQDKTGGNATFANATFATLAAPPIDKLPSPLKDMVQESVTAYGGDGAAPLVWGLATISASTGNLSCVHHQGKYWSPLRLPTSLYLAIIGESGSQKTQSGKAFIDPFNKAMAKHAAEFNEKRKNVLSSIKSLHAQLQGKRNQIAKATEKNEYVDGLKTELAALDDQIRNLVESLTGGAWSIDDATPEKILMVMKRTQGRAAYLGSEARVIQNILGTSYGSGSSEHLVLKAYDGELIKRDRVGTSTDDPFSELVVTSPTLTLLTTFTPTMWQDMLGNDAFKSSGFLSRCLPVQVSPLKQNYYAPSMNPETVAKWDTLIESLASIPVVVDEKGNPVPYQLGLTDDAYKWHLTRCQSFADKWDKRTAITNEWSQDTTEFKNRYNTVTLRLAALLHYIRHRQDFATHKICKDDVDLGWELYQFFIMQFMGLFDLGDGIDNADNVNPLMVWALKRETFTKSDANRGLRFKGDKIMSDLAADALADALSKGWLQYDPQARTYKVTNEYMQWAGLSKG